MNKPKPPQSVNALIGDVQDRTQLAAKMSSIPVSAPVPRQLAPGTVDVVNALFKELQAIFPAWKQAWPDDEALSTAKRSWIKAFMVAGINTLEQIRFGVERCRALGRPFAPSVGEFVAMCQPTPEMLGIPAYDKAFREALENAHPSRASSRIWSHPAVRHAALQCEMHNLGDQISEKASKIFDRAYDITIRQLMAGLPLDDIAIGIGHDSQKSELELANERADRQAQERIIQQGIPTDGASARALLMAKFGKRRLLDEQRQDA
jgi:hypothetical protein